jgi:hypothetical protein
MSRASAAGRLRAIDCGAGWEASGPDSTPVGVFEDLTHQLLQSLFRTSKTTACRVEIGHSYGRGDSSAVGLPGRAHVYLRPQRNWLTLWKPTIDALDPLLGRTREARDWHPQDGRITDLGLHVTVDASLGHDVLISIAAAPAAVLGTEDPS